jgi:putative Mg2+ transporter-C (MgtC) family protein
VITDLEMVARLALAGSVGAIVGCEREARRRTAGLRTHALVAIGAALFTMAGAYGFGDVDKGPNVDPARIAAQVASGIGFIGAGAIIRNGASVRGITTAATVWTSAALGVAAAAGAYVVTVAAAVIVLATLMLLRVARPVIERFMDPTSELEVEYERGHGTIGPLIRAIEQLDGKVEGLQVVDDDELAEQPGLRRLSVRLRISSSGSEAALTRVLHGRPEVRRVQLDDELLLDRVSGWPAP